jgi:hypothetical protein
MDQNGFPTTTEWRRSPLAMDSRNSPIPLCRSEFLQDVSIELGRTLNALPYRQQELEFTVREKDEEMASDQLSTTVRKQAGSYVQVVITAGGMGNFVQKFEQEVKGLGSEYVALAADLTDLSAAEIARLIRDSLYGDSDAIAFWKRRNLRVD